MHNKKTHPMDVERPQHKRTAESPSGRAVKRVRSDPASPEAMVARRLISACAYMDGVLRFGGDPDDRLHTAMRAAVRELAHRVPMVWLSPTALELACQLPVLPGDDDRSTTMADATAAGGYEGCVRHVLLFLEVLSTSDVTPGRPKIAWRDRWVAATSVARAKIMAACLRPDGSIRRAFSEKGPHRGGVSVPNWDAELCRDAFEAVMDVRARSSAAELVGTCRMRCIAAAHDVLLAIVTRSGSACDPIRRRAAEWAATLAAAAPTVRRAYRAMSLLRRPRGGFWAVRAAGEERPGPPWRMPREFAHRRLLLADAAFLYPQFDLQHEDPAGRCDDDYPSDRVGWRGVRCLEISTEPALICAIDDCERWLEENGFPLPHGRFARTSALDRLMVGYRVSLSMGLCPPGPYEGIAGDGRSILGQLLHTGRR